MNEEITMTIDDRERNIDLSLSEDSQLGLSVDSSGGTYDYNKLIHKPQINDVTLDGNKSLEDLGIENDKNYVHNQTTASNTWVIEHNLNKYPSVSIMNSANEEVVGEVTYDNTNQVTIKFAGEFKGSATLN